MVKFLRWPNTEKKLFLEALLLMYISKACLMLFSFKSCIKRIEHSPTTQKQAHRKQLVLIKRAIIRADRFGFWSNVCLVQSITAKHMLNRRGIGSQLKLGVRHDENHQVMAHAWVSVDNYEVVNKGSDYNELISF